MYCNAEFAPALPAPSVWLVVGLRQPLVLKEGHPTPILVNTALHKLYIHQLSIFCAFMVYTGLKHLTHQKSDFGNTYSLYCTVHTNHHVSSEFHF